jgi:hypothetical protein
MCEWELTKAFELDPIGKLGRLTPVLKEPDAARSVPFRYSHIQFLDASRNDWFGRLCACLKFTPPPGAGAAGARLPVAAGILTQVISIGDGRDAAGREVLTYAAAPLPGIDADATETAVLINPAVLESQLARMQHALADLSVQAARGSSRSRGIEDEAAALSRAVLPPGGLAGRLTPGTNPQLDLNGEWATRIPWEAIEERFVWCPQCQVIAGPDDRFCRRCGGKTEAGGGRLGLAYHLTHLVRAPEQRQPSGHLFLVACNAPPDGMRDAGRRDVEAHLEEVRGCVTALGFGVESLTGPDATAARLLDRLGDARVSGLYLLAPHTPDGSGQMGLAMADGIVRATDLENAMPAAGFVFLNLIDAAPSDASWAFERRTGSLAQVFARARPGQLVIAPAWPLPAAHAMRSAAEFFRRVAPDAAIAAAVDGMRRQSAARYDAGQPDVGWLAYRLFGNPNRAIPRPIAAPAAAPAGAPAVPIALPFSDDGEINADAFSCDLPDILLRAARRRLEQKRNRVTVDDLVVGLARRGHLTRAVLLALNVDPDKIYPDIRAARDPEVDPWIDPSSPPGGRVLTERERIRTILVRLIVRRRDEMTAGLAKVFASAAARAQAARGDTQISERDLLEEVLTHPAWERLQSAGLPGSVPALERLAAFVDDPVIDANGLVRQHRLEAPARRVLALAQALAQEFGTVPIPNRVVFAAFLARADSHATRLLQRHRIEAGRVRDMLLRSVARGRRRPIALTLESCAGSIAPMMRVALALAGAQAVTEAGLFSAFCQTAPPGLKEAFKQLGPSLDAIGLDVNPV